MDIECHSFVQSLSHHSVSLKAETSLNPDLFFGYKMDKKQQSKQWSDFQVWDNTWKITCFYFIFIYNKFKAL